MRVKEDGDSLLFYGMKNEDVQGVFYRYLDLGRDYREITDRYNGDKYLSEAVRACPGIRILRRAVGGTLLVYNFAKQQYSAYKGNNKKAL